MSSASPNATPPSPSRSTPHWIGTPPIDIHEAEDGLVLHADLPGVTSETLELQIEENRLTLFARTAAVVPDDAQLIYQEYRQGEFLRSFILSDEVDHDRIEARLTDGVLELRLPRAVRAEPRRIQVRSD